MLNVQVYDLLEEGLIRKVTNLLKPTEFIDEVTITRGPKTGALDPSLSSFIRIYDADTERAEKIANILKELNIAIDFVSVINFYPKKG